MFQRITHGSKPSIERVLGLYALIGPVRCQSALRDFIHTLGANLHFDIITLRISHGDMQTFIAIRLRVRKPIPIPLLVRDILLGHIGIDLPAQIVLYLLDRLAINDESHSEHVEHAFERHFLGQHLLIDAVRGLRADLYLILNARRIQLFLKGFDEFTPKLFPILRRSGQFVSNRTILLRLGELEIDVLEFALYVVKSQLMGQRDVKHKGLELFLLARSFRKNRKVAHNLQTVGYLDDGDTRVLTILDYKFLIILRLEPGVLRLDGTYLIESIYKSTDFRRKFRHIHIGMCT